MRTQRIILAWSELDLDGWRPGDTVVALTAEAYVATHQMPAVAVIDPKQCLGESVSVRDDAIQLVNNLHEAVKVSPLPWLEGYANVIFQIKVYQLMVWLRLLRALWAQVNPFALEICPPKRFSDDSAIYRLAQRSFEVARDILQRE